MKARPAIHVYGDFSKAVEVNVVHSGLPVLSKPYRESVDGLKEMKNHETMVVSVGGSNFVLTNFESGIPVPEDLKGKFLNTSLAGKVVDLIFDGGVRVSDYNPESSSRKLVVTETSEALDLH